MLDDLSASSCARRAPASLLVTQRPRHRRELLRPRRRDATTARRRGGARRRRSSRGPPTEYGRRSCELQSRRAGRPSRPRGGRARGRSARRRCSRSQRPRQALPAARQRPVVQAVNGRLVRDRVRARRSALVGESGSGKTTVGRCLLRPHRPDRRRDPLRRRADRPRLDPQRFRRRPPQIAGRLPGAVRDPQPALEPRHERRGAARACRRTDGGQRARRVVELLDARRPADGVAELFPHQTPAACSSAWRSRARSPSTRALVVLDEPTSALDTRAAGR